MFLSATLCYPHDHGWLRAELVLELDAPPPATTVNPGVGDVEGLLKLGRKLLDRERPLAMAEAPLHVAVEQLRRGDLMPGRDDQLLGNKLFMWPISVWQPFMADHIPAAPANPSRCICNSARPGHPVVVFVVE
jgi:hypothetical protein